MKSLREKLIAAFCPESVQASKYVYVSRLRAKIRKLKNENELLPILAWHDFSIVYFEELSFLEQVLLMRETKVLVGVHGANMANSLFMQPGCAVVELINQENPNMLYLHMCSNLDLPYFSVPCTVDIVAPQKGDAGKVFDANLNNVDYHLDCSVFVKALSSVSQHFGDNE